MGSRAALLPGADRTARNTVDEGIDAAPEIVVERVSLARHGERDRANQAVKTYLTHHKANSYVG
jgi:hypothetical protein